MFLRIHLGTDGEKESFIVEMIKNDFLWSFRAKIAQKYRIAVPGAHRSQFYSKKWFWFFFCKKFQDFLRKHRNAIENGL